MYESFGLDIENDELFELIKDLPKTDILTAKLLLRDTYETTYGIFDHETSTHPWDLVLHREKEEVFKYSAYASFIKRYQALDVNSRFGISLSEFLEFDRASVNEIFRICLELASVENAAHESLKNQTK